MNDRSSKALRHTSSNRDVFNTATEVVETAHTHVDGIVGIVFVDSEDQAFAAWFREMEGEGLERVFLAAISEDAGDCVEHGQVVVVGYVQLQVVDLLEHVAGEEVIELEEGHVDHGVQVLDDEGLAVDDFGGFFVDLLVDEEDGWSSCFLEVRVLVAGQGSVCCFQSAVV